MTDRGDDGGFQPHPGDPWHPGWSDDAASDAAVPPDEGATRGRRRDKPAKAPKESRRRRRQREREEAAAPEEWSEEEWSEGPVDDAEPAADTAPGPAWDDEPTVVGEPVTRPIPPPVEPIRRPERTDPPPAWMTDPPRQQDADPALPVELPSWVGETTTGAEGIEAVFADDHPEGIATPAPGAWDATSDREEDEEVEASPKVDDPEVDVLPEDDQLAFPEAARTGESDEDPLAAALSALAALGEDEPVDIDPAPIAIDDSDTLADEEPADYGVATAAAFEALRRLEGDDQPAAPGAYGVAGKEAFAVLGDGDDTEELADWAAFAGTDLDAAPIDLPSPVAEAPLAAPGSLPVPSDAGAMDPVVEDDAWPLEDDPGRRRGIWPFRRRRRDEEELVEEAADWVDAGQPVPEGWFADVDEDAVVPPPATLPETEWPLPDPDAAYRPPDEPAWTPPPVIRAATPTAPEVQAEPPATPEVFSPPPGWGPEPPMVAAGGDAGVWDQPEQPGSLDDDWQAPAVPTPPATPEGEGEDLDEGSPEAAEVDDAWDIGFDDGTGENLPPPYRERPAERDDWVTTPIDPDPDRTVEMSEFEISESIYTGPGTTEHRGLAEEIFLLGDQDTEWQAMAAAMPGVESGVVGFEDVADLRTGEEYRERAARSSDLGARVATGLVLAVFLFGSLFVGGEALALFIGVLALLGVYEFYATLRRVGFRPLGVLGYLGSAGLLAAAWFHGPMAVPITLGIVLVLTYFVYAFSPLREDALVNGGFTVLGVAWVAGTLAFATPLLRHPDVQVLVLAIVAATVAMDVGAYAVGRTWGKRALAPVLSPNKSVEGLIGGVLLSVGAAVAFGFGVAPFDVMAGIGIGAIVVVFAPLGDLAESMVKRSLGVKDMGSILPGHGGILDRIDAFLFVLPAMWVFYRLAGFLG